MVDNKYCFELVSTTNSYVLGCFTEVERDQWMSVLQNAIGEQLNASVSSSTGSVANKQKQKDVMEKVWEIKGNSTCADCGASFPDWASVNLGITLCIECSGVHRSMGVNFSKVRSLTLDTNIW